MGRGPKGPEGQERHAKAAAARRDQAHGSHARNSPVSWRQTRCEKERSRGLRHLYMVLPHPREKGGASTRHHFPSLPRATSTRHPFDRRPLPPFLGDRGRCALSPLTSARCLAHAPLDPEDDESVWEGGGDERSLGSRFVGVCRRSLGFPRAEASPPFV